MIHIRLATSSDREAVRKVCLSAFPENERQDVSRLAVSLLAEETNPETINLVAEANDAVIGHIAFSPVRINSNTDWSGYILAPLGVRPEYQNRQVGSKLVENGMERLSEMGVNVVFVYGDPKYYGRFGFRADVAFRYSPPYELQYPYGWQAVDLNKGVSTDPAATISCVAPLGDPGLW